ncbi:hypothetical protein KAR91_17855 [Candidatus Pacearchaeota archaeon]|nr:hypothetical protein [Candidatus Pacearchaeota archaeon]
MVRAHYLRDQQDAEMPEEFGFNYPYNIPDIWNMVIILESFQMFPEQGGYMDQDARLMDDILTMKRIKDWERDQHKPKGDDR